MKETKLLLFVLLISTMSVQAQNSKKEERYNSILELINSGKFEYVARKANPQGARQIDLTTNPNYFRVDDMKGSAEMPYFGRSFSAGYGTSGGGIKFDGDFETFDVKKNDKKYRVEIKFKIRGEGDAYQGSMTIASLENATLNIRSNNKQNINYTGYLQELKEKKEK